jgi:hypothetical protein
MAHPVHQRGGILTGPHGGHPEPHHRPGLSLAGRGHQGVPVSGTHDPRVVDSQHRPETLGVDQPQRLGDRAVLCDRGHAAAGEHPRQLGRALERQVSSQPVGLARSIVIHRAEPGRFEPPRGPRAHAAQRVVAVHDDRPRPVQLSDPAVQFLEREIDSARQVRPVVVLGGQHLDQRSPLAGQRPQLPSPIAVGMMNPHPGYPAATPRSG